MDNTGRRILPIALLALYLTEFCVLAIHPYDRVVWAIENAPIVLIVAFLVVTYRWFQFSNLAYLLMSALIFLHTIGGHFTFERVPFGFITRFLGGQRDDFDRFAHLTVGFYAFAIAEFVERRQLSRTRWFTCLFAVFSICTVAMVYEIFEWVYAVSADSAAGQAVLGSQGDVWDTQKDMLCDGLGAIAAILIYLACNRRARVRQN